MIPKYLFFIFLSITQFVANNLWAQWVSLGEDIIPRHHRVWSIKMAPDHSIWAISTRDKFPPTGYAPRIYRSADDGITWIQSEIPEATSDYGWDISPIDSMNAFIALSSTGLFHTTDGGKNWGHIESYPYYCQLVHFFNSSEGWVMGGDQSSQYLVMSVTSDGGKSWTHIGGEDWNQPLGTSLPTLDTTEFLPSWTFSVKSAYDYQKETIMIGTSKGNIWLSTDKGKNWSRHKTPLADMGLITSNVAMKDKTRFMVAGDYDPTQVNGGVPAVSFATIDGGATWVKGRSGLTAAATDYIPGKIDAFIMVGHNDFGWGAEGTAITYDFGANWKIIDNTSIITIDFLDESNGVGTCCNNVWPTANGQIHKWNYEIITTTKRSLESGSPSLRPNPVSNMLTIDLSNGLSGIGKDLQIDVVSSNGLIVKSQNYHNANEININTNNLPFGFYTLRIHGDHKVLVEKFIKE